jgi:hypothetical protein
MLGDDDTFKKGGCNSDGTSDAVEKLCLGKHKCELPGDETGGNAAYGTPKGVRCSNPRHGLLVPIFATAA